MEEGELSLSAEDPEELNSKITITLHTRCKKKGTSSAQIEKSSKKTKENYEED